ncbi:MAG: hypothetical protein HXY22_11410 [Alphaproteobacteria bacterium]|nr:hypothetical protein [Alphaproteobacteria bacterium]
MFTFLLRSAFWLFIVVLLLPKDQRPIALTGLQIPETLGDPRLLIAQQKPILVPPDSFCDRNFDLCLSTLTAVDDSVALGVDALEQLGSEIKKNDLPERAVQLVRPRSE